MNLYIIIFSVFLALVTAFGDLLIKKGALDGSLLTNYRVLAAALLYGLTAYGWYFVLRQTKLSSAVMIYTMSLLIVVVLIGVFYFRERLNPAEYCGMAMAVGALLLLSRFA